MRRAAFGWDFFVTLGLLVPIGFIEVMPGVHLKVTGGRLIGNAYKATEILNAVRSNLLNFTIEMIEQFGNEIEISSFNKQKEQNNQIIFNIMNKTEITNTGDDNLINTGNHANQNAHITINMGDL